MTNLTYDQRQELIEFTKDYERLMTIRTPLATRAYNIMKTLLDEDEE